MLLGHRFVEIRHLNAGDSGFKSLVSCFDTSAFNGLLYRICGNHAVNDRRVRLHRDICDAFGTLASDVIEMRSRAADDCTDAKDSIVPAAFSEAFGNTGNFKGTGCPKHVDIVEVHTVAF